MNRTSKSATSRSTRRRAAVGIAKSRAKSIGVLIADDHCTFLAGLTSIIDMEDDMFVVASATDGRKAAELWRKHRPSVTLLDLRTDYCPSLVRNERFACATNNHLFNSEAALKYV